MSAGSVDRPRVLVAGVGNIFLGDDAFGVEVVQRLARRPQPHGVRIVDFGIRGLDLAYALLDRYVAVILVDATPRGGRPGTLYVLEPESTRTESAVGEVPLMDPHNLDPERVLHLVAALGGPAQRFIVVGCEPEVPGHDAEMPAGMSTPVQAAVDEAVLLVESTVARLVNGDPNSISDVARPCTNCPLP